MPNFQTTPTSFLFNLDHHDLLISLYSLFPISSSENISKINCFFCTTLKYRCSHFKTESICILFAFFPPQNMLNMIIFFLSNCFNVLPLDYTWNISNVIRSMEKWKWKNLLTFVGAVKNCFVTLKINPINQTTEMCVFVIFNFDTSNFWPEINFHPNIFVYRSIYRILRFYVRNRWISFDNQLIG